MAKTEISSAEYRQSLLRASSMSKPHSSQENMQECNAESHERSLKELVQYLNQRINELDLEIRSNLSDRRPDYEWGKRIGRISECKKMLEFVNMQTDVNSNSSSRGIEASLVE